jgi:hypothetical protein
MTNVYSVHGFLTACLLVICSAAYIKVTLPLPKYTQASPHCPVCSPAGQRVPQLRSSLLAEKKGARGTFYKASVIGTRLHWQVRATFNAGARSKPTQHLVRVAGGSDVPADGSLPDHSEVRIIQHGVMSDAARAQLCDCQDRPQW